MSRTPDAADSAADDAPAAWDVALSGATVRVAAGAVTVARLARTAAADHGPVTAPAGEAGPAHRAPTPWLPGEVSFAPASGLPAVRVTAGCAAAGAALPGLIAAAAEGAEALAAAVADLDEAAAADVAVAAGPLPGAGDSPAPEPAAGAEGAGARATRLPIDFIAFDVETANDDPGSIIQIGLAAVRGGAVAETRSWYCRPPAGLEHFAEENIAVHGIRPSDIADAPAFADRLEDLRGFIGDAPVVAHNARFDFTALRQACRAAGAPAPAVDFACTYRWAQAARVRTPNKKLDTLAAAAGHDLAAHHDAAADAVACAEVALWLMRGDAAHGAEEHRDPAAYSAALGLGMGRLDSSGLRMVSGRHSGTGAAAAGGGAARRAAWDAAKAPDTVPEPNPDADPAGLLFGRRVTLTGDFAPYDKGRLWEAIAAAGGIIGKNVTRNTDLLVAGPWDSMTAKERKARELRDKGQEIDIWSERELFDVLGLEAEPPF